MTLPRDLALYEHRLDLSYSEEGPAHVVAPNGSLLAYFPRGNENAEFFTTLVRVAYETWYPSYTIPESVPVGENALRLTVCEVAG